MSRIFLISFLIGLLFFSSESYAENSVDDRLENVDKINANLLVKESTSDLQSLKEKKEESDNIDVHIMLDIINDQNATDGNSLLHEAKYIESLEMLVANKANIELRNQKGETPLNLSAFGLSEESFDKVYFLIKKGADVNTQDNEGLAPLHVARSTRIVEMLIDNGANINIKDKNGFTPLHYAVHRSYYEIVDTLIKKGSRADEKSNSGKTPLHLVKSVDIASLLIKSGVDINAKNNIGANLLHLSKSYDILNFLLDNGGNVNAVTDDNSTPLHTATSEDLVKLFISRGADLTIENKEGYTPLLTSKNIKIESLIRKELKRKGAEFKDFDDKNSYFSSYDPINEQTVLSYFWKGTNKRKSRYVISGGRLNFSIISNIYDGIISSEKMLSPSLLNQEYYSKTGRLYEKIVKGRGPNDRNLLFNNLTSLVKNYEEDKSYGLAYY